MRYRTIVADPPWPIGDFPEWADGKGTIATPYSTMSLDEIRALPVREMGERVAHLYLWTITEQLEASYGVARAWGFEPSAVLTWCKPQRPAGLGGAFPANTEFVLFCTRNWGDDSRKRVADWLRERVADHREIAAEFGVDESMVRFWIGTHGPKIQTPTLDQWERLKRTVGFGAEMDEAVREINTRKGEPQRIGRAAGRWFQWPRGEHSAKPEAFLDLVEQVSPGPYVELFARRARFGWDYWGDESLGTAEMAA